MKRAPPADDVARHTCKRPHGNEAEPVDNNDQLPYDGALLLLYNVHYGMTNNVRAMLRDPRVRPQRLHRHREFFDTLLAVVRSAAALYASSREEALVAIVRDGRFNPCDNAYDDADILLTAACECGNMALVRALLAHPAVLASSEDDDDDDDTMRHDRDRGADALFGALHRAQWDVALELARDGRAVAPFCQSFALEHLDEVFSDVGTTGAHADIQKARDFLRVVARNRSVDAHYFTNESSWLFRMYAHVFGGSDAARGVVQAALTERAQR